MVYLDDDFFERVKHSYMQYWKTELFSYSMQTDFLALTREERNAIIKAFNGNESTESPILLSLANKIETIGIKHEGGFFVKLDSRSPKDSPLWEQERGRCQSGKEAVEMLCDCPRIEQDLCMAPTEHTVYLVIRKWIPIEIWQEFRCFVENGKLIAVSQNHPEMRFDKVVEHKEEIKQAIISFVQQIIPHLQSPSIVLDTFVEADQESGWKVRLIETNPYVPQCSGSLFHWSKNGTIETNGDTPEFRIVEDLEAILKEKRLRKEQRELELLSILKGAKKVHL